MNKPIGLSCYSDVLCVWAYVSEIRLNELREKLGDKVNINYHFISIFGCTQRRIGDGWKDRGGFEGFSDHVTNVGKDSPQVEINPDVWRTTRPKTSATAHLFLKAVQLLEINNDIPAEIIEENNNRTLFEELAWHIRCAFFSDCQDIAQLEVLYNIAESLGLPCNQIEKLINDGTALAALCCDGELRDKHKIEGSPTYLLNDGRQKLYGNVGYRIIEANVEELLERPEGMASWC